jgi:hypothetical protein
MIPWLTAYLRGWRANREFKAVHARMRALAQHKACPVCRAPAGERCRKTTLRRGVD